MASVTMAESSVWAVGAGLPQPPPGTVLLPVQLPQLPPPPQPQQHLIAMPLVQTSIINPAKPGYLAPAGLKSFPNGSLTVSGSRRVIHYNASVLSSHSLLLKNILLECVNDVAPEFRVVLDTNFSPNFLQRLDQFLQCGQITDVADFNQSKIAALKTDFEALGMFLPDVFWQSVTDFEPVDFLPEEVMMAAARVKVEVGEPSADGESVSYHHADLRAIGAKFSHSVDEALDDEALDDETSYLKQEEDDYWPEFDDDVDYDDLKPIKKKKMKNGAKKKLGKKKGKKRKIAAALGENWKLDGVGGVGGVGGEPEKKKLKKKKKRRSNGGLDSFREYADHVDVVFHFEDEVHCPLCTVTFKGTTVRKYSNLNRHLNKSHDKSIAEYICFHCNTPYKNANDCKEHIFGLEGHVREVEVDYNTTRGTTIPCPECQKGNMDRRDLKYHLFHQHDAKLVGNCHHCFRKFTTYDEWNKHVTSLDDEGGFKCPHCKKAFKNNTSDEYTEHLEMHKESICHCACCGKECLSDAALQEHMKNAGDEFHKPECMYSNCSETFASWADHKLHVETKHAGKLLQKCDKCGLTYASRSLLKSHILATHPVMKKEFICPTCGIKCTQSSIKAHMENHQDKTMPCDQCGKLFAGPENMARHRRVHDNVTCDKCGVDLPKRYLIRHMLQKHTEKSELPFQCHICTKGFISSQALQTHMNIHQDLRQFKCSVCHSAFNDVANRNQHERRVHKLVNNGRTTFL